MSTATDDGPRTAAVNPLRLLVWVGIAVGIVYLVFSGGGFPGIYLVQLRILSLAVLAVTLVGWLAWAWRHPAWRPRTAIWPAFALSMSALAIATAASPTPRLGLDYLAYAALLTACYLLLVRIWADPFLRPRLGALTVVAAFALTGLYVAVVVVRWIDWWSVVGAIRTPPLRPAFEGLTYGNPSAVLTVAVLLVTAGIAWLGAGTRGRRVAVGILILLAGAVFVMSGSRAGWLAVPVALGVTGVAWLVVPEHRAGLARRVTGRRAWIGIAAAVVLGVAALAVLGPVILLRLGSGGEAGRATFFATAIRMFLDSPVTGVGPGGWAARRIAFTQAGEIDYYVPHAHDIYLQTAAETGIVGLAVGAVAIGCLLWLVVGALRDPDPMRRRFGWASLFGLAYFGTHQLLDFYANMPAALFAFALPIALLDATSARSVAARLLESWPSAARVGRVALFVGVLASVAVLSWSEVGAVRASRAVDAANRSDWPAALAGAREAAAADPGMPAYQFTLALAAAGAGDLETAASAFERAAIADDLPEAWLDLAAVRLRQGDRPGARDALAKAMKFGGQQRANEVAAAWLDLRLEDREAATEALASALAGTPSLAGDPYLSTDPGFATIRSEAVARAIASAPPTVAWEIALMSGDPTGSGAIALGLPEGDRAFAQQVIAGWGGDRTALADLEARAQRSPLDLGTVAWTARVAAHLGRADVAERYRDWANGIDGSSGVAAAEMRVVDALEPGDVIAGSNTGYHAQYVYRRPAPNEHLVPWLPRLTFR